MAELLVTTRRSPRGDREPGDVIVCKPDGWPWGRLERGPEAADFWKVIEVPGVPVAAFAELMEPVLAGGHQILFRRVRLDLQRIPAVATLQQVMGARIGKSAIPLRD